MKDVCIKLLYKILDCIVQHLKHIFINYVFLCLLNFVCISEAITKTNCTIIGMENSLRYEDD